MMKTNVLSEYPRMIRIFSSVPTGGVFRTCLRTRFAETDLQGVVHHNYYLVYYEQARVKNFRSLGFDYRESRRAGDFDITVVEAVCKYLAPVGFNDELEIAVWSSRVRRASFTLDYYMRRIHDGVEVASGHTVLAPVDASSRKAMQLTR